MTRSARYWLLAALYAIPLALSAVVAPGVDDEVPNWVNAIAVVFWIANAIHAWTARPVVDAAWAAGRRPKFGSLNPRTAHGGRTRALLPSLRAVAWRPGALVAREKQQEKREHIVSAEPQTRGLRPAPLTSPTGPTRRRGLPLTVPPARAGYEPPATPVLGAERNPNVVAVLSIVTLGLYLIYWWYTVNREMRDFARTVQPTHPLASSQSRHVDPGGDARRVHHRAGVRHRALDRPPRLRGDEPVRPAAA